MESLSDQDSGIEAVRQWRLDAPMTRRLLARIGLQGKLILSFTYMLVLTLGVSVWLFATRSQERVTDIMGEQARQLSYALSLASKSPMEEHNERDLKRIGLDLLKARNVMFVAFLDTAGKSIALASRDQDFQWAALAPMRHDTQGLTQVHQQKSPVLGEFVSVMSPVLSVTSPAATARGTVTPGTDSATRLLGYVVVGISQAREHAQLRQITYLIVFVGCGMALLCLPFCYALVHRIFLPIRQLVAATRRIAEGDLDTQVAIHRPDTIGTLARSFNEMVRTVRMQQEALEEANEDLEQKVSERTAQLETANRRLSAEIAEKEDFLRAVSHDLNAPLRNISGMAAMLLVKHKEHFDDDVIHRLERIQKNVQVETDLIGELLELSRIKTRRQRMEPVEIDALVRELGEMLENDLKTRGIALVIDGGRLPVLNCERSRMRQVFQNLIDNAIKYMGDGPTREIHVGCEVRLGEAEFYVRDTGIGIPPEDVGRVFHVFRRGKSEAVQAVAGKGVGLSSVKSIVETYGGSIRVESELGKGSTFRFTVNGQYVARTEQTDPGGRTSAAAGEAIKGDT